MSDIEKTSATWAFIRDWATARLGESREALETHGLDIEETEHQRGRIAVLRELLDLEKPRQKVIVQTDTYGR